jgi:hypothetical protein
VRLTVWQVAPVCRVVGSFTRRGHTGANRIRFNGRFHGRRLPAGTYVVELRAKRSKVVHVTIAIFASGKPSRSAIRAARTTDVCGAQSLTANPLTGGLPFSSASPPHANKVVSSGVEAVQTVSRSLRHADSAFAPGSLAHHVAKNPIVIVCLGLALLLLGMAALPQEALPDPRLAVLVTHRRAAFAAAGGAVFMLGVLLLALD